MGNEVLARARGDSQAWARSRIHGNVQNENGSMDVTAAASGKHVSFPFLFADASHFKGGQNTK